ncbi:hypothetical protein [Patulibacter sp. SYSU D01012]|uniref:hypothetical protein n=1 Tax=Patulibacter sp. SYSU D01012 TaxID=2817381 RepID=UPI001B306DB7|nr:hypothetical protein [Patulibacter sp. SYSU D01012]
MPQPKHKKRRSRKRPGAGARPAAPPPAAAGGAAAPPAARGVPSVKAPREEAPKPLWHPVPVTELLILAGLVLAVVGLVTRNAALIGGGLVLVMASSLELAAREHAAGYRSHSALLAGVAALAVGAGGGFGLAGLGVDVPVWAAIAVAVVVFAGAFAVLRRAFRRRSGGLSFRV